MMLRPTRVMYDCTHVRCWSIVIAIDPAFASIFSISLMKAPIENTDSGCSLGAGSPNSQQAVAMKATAGMKYIRDKKNRR